MLISMLVLPRLCDQKLTCIIWTTGLDSRGALIVIRAMRRIADSGRTVVAVSAFEYA